MSFGDKFCFNRKGGIGRGGWVHLKGANSMATSGLGCRNNFIGTQSRTQDHFLLSSRGKSLITLGVQTIDFPCLESGGSNQIAEQNNMDANGVAKANLTTVVAPAKRSGLD